MAEIEQLETREVYRNKWMRVREDRIRRASGAEGIYGVVEKPDFAIIVPVENQFITVVEQYRYPVGARYWELPQGSWQRDPGEDHAALARAELQEETGLLAERLDYAGELCIAYGFIDQRCHVYVASNLTQGSNRLDEEEEGLISERISITQFEQMMLSGEIKDSATIASYSLAKWKGLLDNR